MFKLCSASVSQLMKSWREFWKSVARASASSSFACRSGEGEKEAGEKKHNTEGESSRSGVSQTEAAFVSLPKHPSHRNLIASARERDMFTKGRGFQ